jgi:hypothetical protein
LFTIPFVGYAGMALVSTVWRICSGGAPSGATALIGGLLYGLIFGTALQCAIAGAVAQFAWKLGLRRLAPRLTASSGTTKTFVWLGAEIRYLLSCTWVILAFGAYSAAALLIRLVRPDE